MRGRFFASALAGIGLAVAFVSSALAGGWGPGCGYCGYDDYPRVYYAPPTYSYAPPTVTVIPHYVVQPHYIVNRTYFVRENHYVNETAAACASTFFLDRLFHPGRYCRY